MKKEKDWPDIMPDNYLDARSMLKFIPQRWEKDLTVMIPCYNEEGNIIETLDILIPVLRRTPYSWEIIVIDDASRDKSGELVQGYINKHPDCCITLRVRKDNAGLAQNYVDGAFLARGKYYKLVCADNAEPKETLEKIFGSLGKADLIIPYHIEVKGRSFFRYLLSKTFTLMVNAISGYKIRYYNGCALCLTYNIMRWHSSYNGFCFQADLITRSIEEGAGYLEIPVISQERKTGVSKALKLMNFFSTAHFFMDLIIRRISQFYSACEKKYIKAH